MATDETHRRRLAAWRRALLAVPAVAVLLAPALLGAGRADPALVWGALALVTFFGVWAGGRAAWHYWVLRGANGQS